MFKIFHEIDYMQTIEKEIQEICNYQRPSLITKELLELWRVSYEYKREIIVMVLITKLALLARKGKEHE